MKYYKLIQSKRLLPKSDMVITCDDSSKEDFKKLMNWKEKDFLKHMEEFDGNCTTDEVEE